ncbi:Dimethylaniline monooxygenase (N-oxide forming) [Chromohalobacter israelensis DSM 3043]|uniref:Dimethylaniline monooxygenase (N-oxide forming) n=2 Tax=Chromohalobacter israelensis TaxID=141390 RepID=Q1QXN8_CHRI1|nr:Dimethylaniline monooxygenase (N-oxide forming) [Chromohalobacter salexigens DSM 3043]
MEPPRYCIIGAGAAGMAALKTLREEGFDVDCFEKSNRVGGHWHTDYEALHLITPRDSSAFEDFPMPDDYPLYPSRDQVRDYLEAYARYFDLERYIRFETGIERIHPLGRRGESGWRVVLSNGETRYYRGVMVANGHLWDPKVPDVASNFTGKSLHSCEYNSVDDLEGKTLVVGFGNSGCDLAVDAAQHRHDVSIVIRRGQVFQPKTLCGQPRSELSFLNELPPEQQGMLTHLLIYASLGPAERYPGLPTPETFDLDAQPPVVNTLLPYWIHHGRVKVMPGIERIEGHRVFFTDGSSDEFGTILWATGFNVRLPFISDELLEWQEGVPLRTAAAILPTMLESLFFVGLCAPRGPQWPVYCAQAHLIADMLRLQESGMTDLAERFRESDTPETRIDIVRRFWQADFDETQRRLAFMRSPTTLSKKRYGIS